MELTLHDYWRSSSAYRVRIAMNLKGVDYRGVEVDLLQQEQRGDAYAGVNAQKMVPALEVNGQIITQSLAIIEWLDRTFPEPALIPADPLERARVLALTQIIVADIQPLQNLRVQKYLRAAFAASDDQVNGWTRHWITEGLQALESAAPDEGFFGGAAPNLVDIVLVPQMYNARRYGVDLAAIPRLVRIDGEARAIDAIAQAAPEAIRPA
ncbi:MAG: maleylacetoacetate isomerase [Novosphingobium sp.]